MAGNLKSKIVSTFRMHGLTLRSDATKYLTEILTPINDSQHEECIEKVITFPEDFFMICISSHVQLFILIFIQFNMFNHSLHVHHP